MRNHSNKRFRGKTMLTTAAPPVRNSRLYIQPPVGQTARQCGACKHKFTVPTKVNVSCPECGGITRVTG